eukprot:scaffold2063_cov401-Prasinococcus_capsulatus_cf.AAC.8
MTQQATPAEDACHPIRRGMHPPQPPPPKPPGAAAVAVVNELPGARRRLLQLPGALRGWQG